MAKRKPKPKCMTKTCERTDIIGYGFCKSCYQHHKREVDLGRETWEDLIANGKALPLGARRNRSKAALDSGK